MVYDILKDGKIINTIVADEAFVTDYCKKNGYTYEVLPEPEVEQTLTTEERVKELEEAMELLLSGATGEEVAADET